MAIYHLSAGIVSRGSGHSSTGKAAYNARCSIVDERTGRTHDYSRHSSRCIFEGIYAPKDAPEWTRDRAQLWNHVEAFEKHRNAQVARTLEIALPHELTPDQQRQALQDFVRDNFTRKGLIADVAIHEPGKDGDHRNTHAHIMFVTRKLDGSEFAKVKADRADSLKAFKEQQATELEGWRESWEKTGNRHLKRHGHAPTLDRRTLEAQGIDRTPGVHLGKAASEMEARGMETGRGDRQRDAANQNEARDWIAARQAENERLSRADFAAMQAANAAQQNRDRADLENETRPLHKDADAGFVPTLEGIRQREAEDVAGRGSMDAAAKRAMDDLAAVDPIGTARHFGHQRGDRLKTPEEMRAEWAATVRAASRPAMSTEPEQARDSATPDPTPAPPEAQPVHQVDAKRDHLADRMAWAERLKGFDMPTPSQTAQPAGQGRGPEMGGAEVAPPLPEATQRASYEAEKPQRTRQRGFFGRLWERIANFGSPAMPRSGSDDEAQPVPEVSRSQTHDGGAGARGPDSGPVNAAVAAEARQAAAEAARPSERNDDAAREIARQIAAGRQSGTYDKDRMRDLAREHHRLTGAAPDISPAPRRSPLEILMERVKAEQVQEPTPENTRKRGGGRTMGDDEAHDRRHHHRALWHLLHPFQQSHRVADRHREP